MGERLIRITYVSRTVDAGFARGADRPEGAASEVESILAVSRRNNARVGVTGALIFNRSTFGQVLEGPEEAVDETYARIEADPRHRDVEVLDLRSVEERGFGDWSMGFVGRQDRLVRPGVEDCRTTLDLRRMGGDQVFGTLYRIALGRDTAMCMT